MGFKMLTVALATPVLLMCATGVSAQEARLNPCVEYQTYVDAGNEGSLMAQSFQKVCETVGHVELTNDCMTYYSFVNSFGEDSPMTQARAQTCDASMPDLRSQIANGPAPAADDQMAAADSDDGNAQANVDPVQDGVVEPVQQDMGQIEENSGADSQGDIALWDSIKESDSAEMYQAYLAIYPDGLFAPIARIRAQNLQIAEQQSQNDQIADDSNPVEQEDDAVASDAEVAFWNSVKDSDAPDVLQSYLEAYPDGLYVLLAEMMIQEIKMAAEPEPAYEEQPVDVPAEETANAETELAFWESVKDSGSPEMLGTYLAAYPDGTFAPIARVMLDRLGQDTAVAAQEQDAIKKDKQQPKTAKELFKRAQTQMKKAAKAKSSEKAAKIRKRARRNYRKAADLGHVKSMMKVGDMFADGIGGKKNLNKAVTRYLAAAEKGEMDGFEKALHTLDEKGNATKAVEVLVEFYKKRPKRAVDTLNTLSDKSIMAVQRMLKKQGYYHAGIDGDFGQLSEKALRLYSRGAPKPKVKVVKKYITKNATNVRASPLAAKLQRQLKRVWCYRGAIDGVWGPGSRNAMHSFNIRTGNRYAISGPSAAAYNRVRSIRRPVCGIRR